MKKYLYLIATIIIFFAINGCKKKSNDAQQINRVNVVFISISGSPPFTYPQIVKVSSTNAADFNNPLLSFSVTGRDIPVTVQMPIGQRWISFNAGGGDVSQQINITGVSDTVYFGLIAQSDKKYKKNIATIKADQILPNFMQLQTHTYQYKADEFPSLHFFEDYTYGFIAQDVEKTMPWLVSKNEQGYRSINYMAVIPMLTTMVQQQQKQIELLQKELQSLKNKNQ